MHASLCSTAMLAQRGELAPPAYERCVACACSPPPLVGIDHGFPQASSDLVLPQNHLLLKALILVGPATIPSVTMIDVRPIDLLQPSDWLLWQMGRLVSHEKSSQHDHRTMCREHRFNRLVGRRGERHNKFVPYGEFLERFTFECVQFFCQLLHPSLPTLVLVCRSQYKMKRHNSPITVILAVVSSVFAQSWPQVGPNDSVNAAASNHSSNNQLGPNDPVNAAPNNQSPKTRPRQTLDPLGLLDSIIDGILPNQGAGQSSGSPAYSWLFQYPLPIPEVATPMFTETVNGIPIEYYETTIEPF